MRSRVLAALSFVVLSGCGQLGPLVPPTRTPVPPTPAPTAVVTPVPLATNTPRPTVTPVPVTPTVAKVAHLVLMTPDGEGAYIRSKPSREDDARIRVLPDGTVLEDLGDQTEADGITWRHVRVVEDSTEGYVASEFLTSAMEGTPGEDETPAADETPSEGSGTAEPSTDAEISPTTEP